MYKNFSTLFIFIAIAVQSMAQDGEPDFEKMLRDKQFVFLANTALPTTGGMRQLTFGYDVQLAPDSLISHLPFFGRAFRAPINPREAGIQFISTAFDYEVKEKDNGWSITMKPRDNSDVEQMHLFVSANGYASLQVISTYRQPITFNGRVEERKNLRGF